MVVMVLLSLIVLALMAVFNFTQTAFRKGVTQVDVLESGRATIDLLAADLRNLAPSRGATNGAVNFYACTNGSAPLVQSLVGGSQPRVNVLEKFFILSRNNVNGQDIWTGTGYVVDTRLDDRDLSALPFFRQHERRRRRSGCAVQRLHEHPHRRHEPSDGRRGGFDGAGV